MMVVDFHVHARDEEQKAKETFARSLKLAEAAGLDAVAVMPNTARPLTTLERCMEYLANAHTLGSLVEVYAHIGLTPDVEQVKRAIDAFRVEPRIIGLKAYFGKSTGDLSIVDEEKQCKVWNVLAEEGFDGVLVGHCEKEALMDDSKYNPDNPVTHSTLCRPEEAEIESFRDNFGMARETGFQGTFHIAHVSTRYVADFVRKHELAFTEHNRPDSFHLSCGVTPHHALLSNEYLRGRDGAWYKCNPALRSASTQENLYSMLMEGKIPIIETDHAPHTEEDKQGPNPASGIANLWVWPYFIEHLREQGMPDQQIQAITHDNVLAVYKHEFNPDFDELEPNRPVNWEELEMVKRTYHFDAFRELFPERAER